MLTNHSQITKEECRASATKYFNAQGRAAQNDFQLLSTLSESVDADTTAKMANESSQYHISTQHYTGPSGLLYLKHLLSKAVIDSRAVGSHVRSNLAKLPDHMANIANDNILIFNDYVREQVALLTARGETSTDLMDNLFAGYLACNDQRFVSYIERVQQDWQDDPSSSLTHESLMTKAEGNYKARLLANNWKSMTKEQEEIVALRAKLDSWKPTRSGTGKGKRNQDKQETQSTTDSGKKKFTGKHAWRNVAPKAGGPTTKKVDGAEWHYCKFHGYWVKHTSEECRLNPANKNQSKDTSGEPEADINAAMAEMGIEEADDEDDE